MLCPSCSHDNFWHMDFTAVNYCEKCGAPLVDNGDEKSPDMVLAESRMKLVCTGGHDRCYLGPDPACPYCEKRQKTMKTLSSSEVLVLGILYDHGPMSFRSAADLSACERLSRRGYIKDHGPGAVKSLTAKGHRQFELQETPARCSARS